MSLSFQFKNKGFYELKRGTLPWLMETCPRVCQISFHRRIYRLKALKQAIEAFRSTADIVVKSGNPYHAVTVSCTDPDSDPELLKEITGSFVNHALFFSIQQKRK